MSISTIAWCSGLFFVLIRKTFGMPLPPLLHGSWNLTGAPRIVDTEFSELFPGLNVKYISSMLVRCIILKLYERIYVADAFITVDKYREQFGF